MIEFIPEYRFKADRAIVLAPHQSKLATPDELKTLRGLSAEHAKLRAQILTVAQGTVKQKRIEAKAAYAENPTDENFKAMSESFALDDETSENRRRQAIGAVKEQIQEVMMRAVPVVEKIRKRAAEIVLKELSAVSEIEKKTAERIGVPFHETICIGALKSLHLELDAPDGVGNGLTNFADLLRGLVTL